MTHTSISRPLRWLAKSLPALCLLPAIALAQAPAATIVMLTGQVTALSSKGIVRQLAKGDSVFSGELINSGRGSYVNLHFADGGYFLLKPDTRFAIESFSVNEKTAAAAAPAQAPPKVAAATPAAAPQPALVVAQSGTTGVGARAFFRLLKGGFRSVSGLVGKINREEYRVVTPVATIGIRGTKYGADVCEDACADRAEINARLQAAGLKTNGKETVLVTHVENGEILVTSSTGERLQGPGRTLLTTENGDFVTTDEVPKSLQMDLQIQPETCGN